MTNRNIVFTHITLSITWLVVAFVIGFMSVGCSPEKGDQGEPGESVVGPAGATGPSGVSGLNGQDGQSIIGPVGPSGSNGTNGTDAVMQVIDPCGRRSNFDEVLFRLADGRIFAYFESGANRYLTLIPPGTYQTTDGTACVFAVTAEGDVTWAD